MRRQRIVRGLEVAAAAAGVATAVIAAGRFVIDSSGDLLRTDSSHLEVRQVVVVNPRMDLRQIWGGLGQTPDSMPQLDITVRNTGRLPALLTAVRVTVEDSERLATCYINGGDAVPVSGSYAITLPLLPTPGERTVTRPLHQEVPAGELDRFQVRFRLPWNDLFETYVYALHVELVSEDSDRAIELGRFVLGVPDTVFGASRKLPLESDLFYASAPSKRLVSTWCVRRNLASLDRFLRGDGRRSSSMAALADFHLPSWWHDFADRRPPEAAIEPLLAAGGVEGALLALFAAERTGDPDLEAETRSRAADLLLDTAEEALERFDYAWLAEDAIVAVRYALLVEPTPEAKQLLGRAEAELEVREAEQAEMEAEALE